MITTFSELSGELADGEITENLMNCVELVAGESGFKLQLNDNIPQDQIPVGFDIDHEIYKIQRQEEMRIAEAQPASKGKRKRVVAEGDSWFNLPPLIRPKAIADRLKSNRKYKVSNIAYWGHTLESIYNKKEYLDELENFGADFLMFSAGGNDLQNRLEKDAREIIHEYEFDRDEKDYLTDAGVRLFEVEIRDHYENLLAEVTNVHSNLPILCHAYDYPRPLTIGGKGKSDREHGKYIGQYLKDLGIPNNKMKPIIIPIMDRLNSVIEGVTKNHGNATFIDCRNVTDEYKWRDDMHPHRKGFIALANLFQENLDILSGAS